MCDLLGKYHKFRELEDHEKIFRVEKMAPYFKAKEGKVKENHDGNKYYVKCDNCSKQIFRAFNNRWKNYAGQNYTN